MPNKIKEIFEDDDPQMVFNITFKDAESGAQFGKTLDNISKEGEPAEVEGVSIFRTGLKDGQAVYPVWETNDPGIIKIGPQKYDNPIAVNTDYGSRIVHFNRFRVNDGVILETEKQEIVYMRLHFKPEICKVDFSFMIQPRFGEKIEDVISAYNTARHLLEMIFDGQIESEEENRGMSVESLEMFFADSERMLGRAQSLEKLLNISFEPKEMEKESFDRMDIEELYMLLIEHRTLRLNAHLSEPSSTGFRVENPEAEIQVGHSVDITFKGETRYSVLGCEITVYTTNLLANAVIKKLIENEDGSIKVLYGENDNAPMYISYRGFMDEQDAESEMKEIMQHKESYVSALTCARILQETP